ncbi:MAG: diguanylate cyclase [Pseudorhodoplanes sp.]
MLNPRKSFATWRETVRGRSRPWKKIEIESVQWFSPRAAFVLQQSQVRELNHLLGDANQRLATVASTDGLTGVPNRRAFDERLKAEWARASRSLGSLAMIILDLDLFKQYNDHYGHLMGDDCLKQVGQCLQVGRRSDDLAARIGGEEFALLLPDTDINGAATVAETLRSRIQALKIPHPNSPVGVVTASFGLAAAKNDGGGSVQELMEAADLALYEAKKNGRNRIARFGVEESLQGGKK